MLHIGSVHLIRLNICGRADVNLGAVSCRVCVHVMPSTDKHVFLDTEHSFASLHSRFTSFPSQVSLTSFVALNIFISRQDSLLFAKTIAHKYKVFPVLTPRR